MTKKKIPQPHTLINNIKRLIMSPCDTPASVYLETALPSVVGAFQSIISPDPKEIYHQLRGNSVICDFKGALESADFIPPAEESAATRFFFGALEKYDLSIWYMFLAGIAEKGLMDWTSQLLRMEQCQDKQSPYHGHGEFFFGALPDSGDWRTLSFGFEQPCRYYPANPSNIILAPGRYGFVSGSAAFKTFGEVAVAAACRVINKTTGEVLDYHQNAFDLHDAPHGSTHVWWGDYNNTQQTWEIAMEWSFGGGIVPEHEVFPVPEETFCFLVNTSPL